MKQIFIISENSVCEINKISKLMHKNGINIESVETQDIGTSKVITLKVDNNELALKALNQAELKAVAGTNLLIKVKDQPGALAEVALKLKLADIESKAHHIMTRDGDNSIAAISTSRLEDAKKILKNCLIS
ncbi:MAG: hypothetical protein ABH859_06425 [Pseudomonadota bacterium]